MPRIAAFITQYDLAITFTFYDRWKQTKRRTFYLRNLDGASLESQLEHALQIANEMAQEIHYMTGVGLDKVDIKSGRKRVDQEVFNMEPHEQLKYFKWGIKFSFTPVMTFQWQKEGERPSWYIPEEAVAEGWQRHLIRRQKTHSFNLPCMPRFPAHRAQTEHTPFIQFVDHKKRGRRTVGWQTYLDQKDSTFQRFIQRFYEKGNLSLGEKRYFGTETYSRSPRITGVFFSPPKIESLRAPRKSWLASQPTDDTDYVYIIRMGRKNIFKIGKSNDPQGRLANLQTSSPFKLSLFHVFRADNASAAEESLHASLLTSRMGGEWFKLTNEQKKVLTTVTEFKENRFVVADRRLTAEALLKGRASDDD